MKRYYDLFGQNLPQAGAEIYAVPWGHLKVIIDKCKGDPEKALFFICEVIKNNWSRAVLLNFLDTSLYERQGSAISNFQKTLPAYTGDLAQEITKDSYNFDFIAINRDYNERELKDALTEKVVKLLMEMGKGFAFVGKANNIRAYIFSKFKSRIENSIFNPMPPKDNRHNHNTFHFQTTLV